MTAHCKWLRNRTATAAVLLASGCLSGYVAASDRFPCEGLQDVKAVAGTHAVLQGDWAWRYGSSGAHRYGYFTNKSSSDEVSPQPANLLTEEPAALWVGRQLRRHPGVPLELAECAYALQREQQPPMSLAALEMSPRRTWLFLFESNWQRAHGVPVVFDSDENGALVKFCDKNQCWVARSSVASLGELHDYVLGKLLTDKGIPASSAFLDLPASEDLAAYREYASARLAAFWGCASNRSLEMLLADIKVRYAITEVTSGPPKIHLTWPSAMRHRRASHSEKDGKE